MAQVCTICGGRDHGQPTLALPLGAYVRISLARCENIATLAIRLDAQPVGVDIEAVRGADWTSVNELVLDHEEQRLMRRLRVEHAAASVRAWTSKEAVLKGVGLGLNIDPRRVRVHGAILRGRRGLADIGPSQWLVVPFRISESHFGALAVPSEYSQSATL